LEKILITFNSFFQGNAEAKIVGDRLEITIGSQTLIISLPEVIGGIFSRCVMPLGGPLYQLESTIQAKLPIYF